MPTLLHQHTPSLTVIDPRGLTVRSIAYHRQVIGEAIAIRVHRRVFDARSQLIQQWDPRLFELSETEVTIQPNQATRYSLIGQVLQRECIDAGARIACYDAAGFLCDSWDSRDTHRRYIYDELMRPISVFEHALEHCTEHFTYGGSGEEDIHNNRCGQLIRHDDPAGSLWNEAFALTGQPLRETRQFCKTLTPPDWPASEADLEDQSYITHWRHDALGAIVEQIDARDHVQRFEVNVSGKPFASWLDGVPLLKSTTYNAFERSEITQTGNDVITTASYSPVDGLLRSITAKKLNGGTLQELHYQYDPFGNVERIEDLAQPEQWFSQQHIQAVSTYSYDTLYQLSSATGRENASQTVGPDLPGLEILGTTDDSRWRNYSQTYTYDNGGNLTRLKHDAGAGNTYIREMVVDEHSNRSVFNDHSPIDFAREFDANGNQQNLSAGQLMYWDTRNQLYQVTLVKRDEADGQDDDVETYVYDGDGQRVRKVRRAKTRSGEQVSEVRYLPGLELRTRTSGETVQVVVAQAGRDRVHWLHWEHGRRNGTGNDQLRYNLSDHLGNTLELDQSGGLITQESYYPYGGTAWWAAKSAIEAKYKPRRYSDKERDASGLYYYGYRYYAPWLQRWLSPDPAGELDELNLFRMVKNNPIKYRDDIGLMPNDTFSGASSKPEENDSETQSIADVRSIFSPMLGEIAIVDIPYRNANGLTQYRHDENHQRVRTRRIQVARELNLSLGDAANDREFQLSLANRVINERDSNGKLFGHCAEMAYVSAIKLEHVAREKSYNVFTFQQPDLNHAMTLLSVNNYKSGDVITWEKETKNNSIVVDLWQGTLSPNSPSALVSHPAFNNYTNKNSRSIIQAKIWNFSNSTSSTTKKTSTLRRLRALFK